MGEPTTLPRPSAVALRLAIVGAALAAVFHSCAHGTSSPSVRSESIGHLGHGYRRGSLTVSRDHRHLAWVQQTGDGCRIVVDHEKGRRFPNCGDPRFSPDGATVAYWAVEEGGRGHLVVNGEASTATFGRDGPIAFSKRGGAWATIAPAYEPPAGGEAHPGNRQESGADPPEHAVAPAARRLLAIDRSGVLGEYHDTTSPALSPDGSHVAYVAADAAGVESLIVDGKVVQSFGPPLPSALPAFKEAKPGPNLDPESAVAYLPDGSLLSIVVGEAGWTFRHGADVWATYATPRFAKSGFEPTDPKVLSQAAFLADSLVVAANAPVACWWERLEGGIEHWRVMCNGAPIDDQTCNYYVADVPIAVAAGRRAAAYACQINPPHPEGSSEDRRNLWVIAGGRKHGPHRFVWGVDLSGDGSHYAYAAADTIDDPWFYVVDGKRYDGPWQQAYPPKLSRDGSTVVWAASRDANGRRQDLVYDGRSVARAELIMTPPIFQGERQVEWAVKRGRSVRRVIVSG